jgi:hypothetical protein
MGLGLVARSSEENGLWHGDRTCASGALTTRSLHAVRACDGTVARSPAALQRLADGKVYPRSTSGPCDGTGQGGGGGSAPERWVNGGGGTRVGALALVDDGRPAVGGDVRGEVLQFEGVK